MIVVALAVLILPGIAIAVLADGEERDPVCFLASAGASAASVAVILPWVVRAPIGLAGGALLAAAFSVVALAVFRRRLARALGRLDWNTRNRAVVAVVALLAVLRLAPYSVAAVAPGADMSMHSYTARLILEADGLPSSYRPLLPVDTFGASAPGLPTLGAVLSAISGAPVERSTFLVACLGLVLASLTVYAFSRSRAGAAASAAGMLIVTVAARDPQAHFEWGGNPTVLSLALATYALLLIERLGERTSVRLVGPAALAASAAVLAHAVIPYALAFVLPPVLLVRLYASPSVARGRLTRRWLAVAVASVVLLWPYLARFQVPVSPAELDWIRHWQRLPVHVPVGPVWTYPVTLVWYVATRLGVVCALWMAVALVVRRAGSAAPAGQDLLFGALTLLVVVNAVFWVLPGSYALYPDRVILLLTPVGGRLVATATEAWTRRRTRVAKGLGLAAALASVLLGAAIWFNHLVGNVAVTGADLEAIHWVGTHTTRDAIIENNYGDAGIWIPALAFRAVCSPHMNIIYMDQLEAWRRTARPTFLYVGARRVIEDGSPFVRSTLVASPDHYVEVFRRGEAAVFRLVPDPATGLLPCAPSTAVTVHPAWK